MSSSAEVEENKKKKIKTIHNVSRAVDDNVVMVVSPSKDSLQPLAVDADKDDSKLIQKALDKLKNDHSNSNTIVLKGDFVIANTIYLPTNFTWILEGSISLNATHNTFDRIEVINDGVTSKQYVAITLKADKVNDDGTFDAFTATNITMKGGTYDGQYAMREIPENPNKEPARIRFMQLSNITNSTFENMKFRKTTNDCFTLQAYARNNIMRNLHAKHSNQNGLADKGMYNKWYDCIAEDCISDGYVPKCQYSTFVRCIGRRCGGPPWGLFARIDGNIDKGAKIVGNKFIDIVGCDSGRSGFSINVDENKCPGAVVRDNYISGKFCNNKLCGVSVRNTEQEEGKPSEISHNEFDVWSYGNDGIRGDKPISYGTGFRVTGDNANYDIDLGSDAANCVIKVYNPDNRDDPATIKSGYDDSNAIVKKTFCSVNSTSQTLYREKQRENNYEHVVKDDEPLATE